MNNRRVGMAGPNKLINAAPSRANVKNAPLIGSMRPGVHRQRRPHQRGMYSR